MMRSAVCRLCAVFLALAMLASVAGCAGSASGTRFYVLTPVPAVPAPAQAMDVAVVVAGVRLPQYLERPQIVTRSGDNRLQFAEFDQWGGNLHQDMTRVLAESLTRLLGSERVVAAPHTLRMQPDYRVEVEVLGFERGPDGRVRLAAKWWLMRSGDAAPLAGPGAELYGAPLPDAEAYDAVVASMSQVYGEFARVIAQAIRQRAAARP
jgi:uncharacterized lipoprotein YmbA